MGHADPFRYADSHLVVPASDHSLGDPDRHINRHPSPDFDPARLQIAMKRTQNLPRLMRFTGDCCSQPARQTRSPHRPLPMPPFLKTHLLAVLFAGAGHPTDASSPPEPDDPCRPPLRLCATVIRCVSLFQPRRPFRFPLAAATV